MGFLNWFDLTDAVVLAVLVAAVYLIFVDELRWRRGR